MKFLNKYFHQKIWFPSSLLTMSNASLSLHECLREGDILLGFQLCLYHVQNEQQKIKKSSYFH